MASLAVVMGRGVRRGHTQPLRVFSSQAKQTGAGVAGVLKWHGVADVVLKNGALAPSDQSHEYHSLVHRCRETFVQRGWCHVPNFVGQASLLSAMLLEVDSSLAKAMGFYSTEEHTVYQEEIDDKYAASHIRNALQKSSKRIIDFAYVQQNSPLRALYNSPGLQGFVGRVVGIPTLHPSGCPYNGAYYNVFQQGDGLGWHFDRSEFGVNLVLQNASQGAHFEHCKGSRSEQDLWNFDVVQRVIQAANEADKTGAVAPGVERVEGVGPGSLIFFAGRLALHRVTMALGPRPRINAIMTYEKEAGKKTNAYSLKKFFGR